MSTIGGDNRTVEARPHPMPGDEELGDRAILDPDPDVHLVAGVVLAALACSRAPRGSR